MGKIGYEQLFEQLQRFYHVHNWADWYVLPDHVPCSLDTDSEVEFKVRETIDFARLFVRQMPAGLIERAIGVVHGRTEEQVYRCVEAYREMGIRYLGFGSFSTSGPKGSINLLSQRNLQLLQRTQQLTREQGLKLHLFGVGSPGSLVRLARAGITPTSFDSASWWKAGGFGNIFFPFSKQIHITAMPHSEATLTGAERQRNGHRCAFCTDLRLLRRNRLRRVLHNLAVMLDSVERAPWATVDDGSFTFNRI